MRILMLGVRGWYLYFGMYPVPTMIGQIGGIFEKSNFRAYTEINYHTLD